MSKSDEWRKEYKQIRHKIRKLGVNIFKRLKFLQTTTLKNQVLKMVKQETERQFDQERESESLFQFLNEQRILIKSLNKELSENDKSQINLQKLQKATELIQENLSHFKVKMMKIFDNMSNQEDNLQNDINVIANSLQTFSTNNFHEIFKSHKKENHKPRSPKKQKLQSPKKLMQKISHTPPQKLSRRKVALKELKDKCKISKREFEQKTKKKGTIGDIIEECEEESEGDYQENINDNILQEDLVYDKKSNPKYNKFMDMFADGGMIKDPNQELLSNLPVDLAPKKKEVPTKVFGGIPKPKLHRGNSSQLKGQFQIKSNAQIKVESMDNALKNIQEKIENANERNRIILEEIEENGGKNCGWIGPDHNEFLKIRTKHRNNMGKMKFIKDCRMVVPYFQEEEIQEHIDQFEVYLDFIARKKILMKEWQTLRKKEKEQLKLKHNLEEKIEKTTISQKRKVLQLSQKRRQRQKNILQEWKIKKLQNNISLTKENEVPKRKKRRLSLKEIERRRFNKIKIKEYKEMKLFEKEQMEATKQKETKKKKVLTKKQLERIAQRNQNILDEKLFLLDSIKQQEKFKSQENQQRQEFFKSKYNNVGSKLNELTLATQEKQRGKFDFRNGQGKDGIHQIDRTGKAMPSWMKQK